MRWGCVNMLVVMLAGCTQMADTPVNVQSERSFTVRPIGQVVRRDGRTFIELEDRYVEGLLGLRGGQELTVVYWFDRNDVPEKRTILQVHPRGDQSNPLTGVFATHAPVRPNLIAISRCRIVAVQGAEIEINQIDAFDNTPVLDLKGDFFRWSNSPDGGTDR